MKKNSKKKKIEVELSNLDKIFFKHPTITKGEVVEYYRAVASYMLPFLKDRPLMMQRFPNGINEEGFYQKEISDYFPSWIPRVTVPLRGEKKQTLVMVEKEEDLIYLANQAVLTFHGWSSTAKKLEYPNKMIFDFDPSKNTTVRELRFAARVLKKMLEKRKLVPFVMTTGSRGFHVVVPLQQTQKFNKVRAFARSLAEELVEQYPDRFTTELSKKKRQGKIFIDYLRNGYGATSVVPYSVRPKQKAPVAMPISWKSLGRVKPQSYTIKNVVKYHLRKSNPWKGFDRAARALKV
jgi:bifunctional non-homologous end joining protein LigD